MGRADVIVTFNLKDFDDAALPGELFAQSPDEFLLDVLGLYPEVVRNVLTTVVSGLAVKDLDGLSTTSSPASRKRN